MIKGEVGAEKEAEGGIQDCQADKVIGLEEDKYSLLEKEDIRAKDPMKLGEAGEAYRTAEENPRIVGG